MKRLDLVRFTSFRTGDEVWIDPGRVIAVRAIPERQGKMSQENRPAHTLIITEGTDSFLDQSRSLMFHVDGTASSVVAKLERGE